MRMAWKSGEEMIGEAVVSKGDSDGGWDSK